MSITWNGVSSDTIGVIVERIPNRYVPTRRFSPQQVAGRNGNILLVDKSFPNVEQEYEVYLSAEAQGLPSVARACAEWLMGPDGYCRLEDSYDTTVYREAFLMGGYDLENILNKFGRCTITFSCKPQKYLLTGDTPIEIPAGITTYTGDVVQFDGVTGASITSLSTTITPTQDLHGYDHPWPAGGGKNKCDYLNSDNLFIATSATVRVKTSNIGTISISGNDVTLTRTAEAAGLCVVFRGLAANTEYCFSEVNNRVLLYYYGKITWIDGTSYTSERIGSNSHTFTTTDAGDYEVLIWKTGKSDIVIQDAQLELGTTPTTFAPYSNICPISGRTGLSVYRTGKNLYSRENGQYNVPVYATDGTSASYPDVNVVYIPVKPNTKYTITPQPNSTQYYVRWIECDGNKGYVWRDSSLTTSATSPRTYTTRANTEYLQIAANQYNAANINKNDWEICIQEGTDTTYYPYSGNQISTDWTSEVGTVYGGTLDVVTGVLTVTHKYYENAGTGGWAEVTSGGSRWIIGGITTDAVNNSTNGKCNMGNLISNTVNDGVCVMSNGRINLCGSLYSAFADVNALKTYLQSHPLQLVYELATPLTYQLTGQEIEVLVGKNNVWTSSGPVSATVVAPFVGTVTNPTPFEARPMLEVSGVGEITINGKSIQILESVSDFLIDCEAMEAEDNSKIYCMDFPELSGGENEIVGDGSITALTVTPRWWTL